MTGVRNQHKLRSIGLHQMGAKEPAPQMADSNKLQQSLDRLGFLSNSYYIHPLRAQYEECDKSYMPLLVASQMWPDTEPNTRSYLGATPSNDTQQPGHRSTCSLRPRLHFPLLRNEVIGFQEGTHNMLDPDEDKVEQKCMRHCWSCVHRREREKYCRTALRGREILQTWLWQFWLQGNHFHCPIPIFQGKEFQTLLPRHHGIRRPLN
eukprot:CCRYP_014721-RD/>CCRYP_014721-RD protein AED:0.47 eAED:1.00 QI:0/0/0/1/0/0/2/0/206